MTSINQTTNQTTLRRPIVLSLLTGVVGLVGIVGMAVLTPAVAGKVPVTKKPMTVLAMMKVESDYLAKWQAEQRKLAVRRRPGPSLLSIYGVLPQLRATVLVNGHEVVFEQGQNRPVAAHAGHTGSMRLRYIKPPCVSFVHQARRQTLCLPKVGS